MKIVAGRPLRALSRAMSVASSFAEDPGQVKALLEWPKFSLSSYSVVSRLRRQEVVPRTVIDVGANTGQFAVTSAKLWPGVRIHSFEPVPECVGELRKNLSGLANVTVHHSAVGDEEGVLELHVNSHRHSSSLLPLAEAHRRFFPEAQEQETIGVEVSTLDGMFGGRELESPVLLKLDVQGYEARVLRGAKETLKLLDYVMLEASFKPLYEGEMVFMELVSLMEEFGFRFERPVGWLSAPDTGEILQMDALFVQKS